MKKVMFFLLSLTLLAGCCRNSSNDIQICSPVDYVTTIVGTQSTGDFSTGNTYPATAMPWGMNFWTPQTGENHNRWAYSYNDHTIRGFRQIHQPSPWIGDYGTFSIMPVKDIANVGQEARASWFSHKSETTKPHYYQVYLADPDVNVEIAPTDRAAAMRFTFPDSETSGFVVDAFHDGSYVKFIPEENAVVGYSTMNYEGVPDNFRNWFVIKFDKPVESFTMYDTANKAVKGNEVESDNALAAVSFRTKRGDIVNVKAASSFISLEQAYRNLEEVGDRTFDQVCQAGKERWNEVLGRIEVKGGTVDELRTFYSCLYRSTL